VSITLPACSKYHSKSVDAPKGSSPDVSVTIKATAVDLNELSPDEITEMNEFTELESKTPESKTPESKTPESKTPDYALSIYTINLYT
jgi:hypothetical protein